MIRSGHLAQPQRAFDTKVSTCSDKVVKYQLIETEAVPWPSSSCRSLDYHSHESHP